MDTPRPAAKQLTFKSRILECNSMKIYLHQKPHDLSMILILLFTNLKRKADDLYYRSKLTVAERM